MPKILFLFMGLVLALSGCAKKNSESIPAAPNTISNLTTAEAKNLAAGARAFCGDAPCNPSVALISSAHLNAAEVCTGTLIQPDLILTASHCIPEDLRAPHSSCQGRVFANFAADGKNLQFDRQINCQEIIFASDFGSRENVKTDFAYIKLARPSNRPYHPLSRAGMNEGERFELNKINPELSNNQLRGILKRETCRAALGSEILARSTHFQSELVLVAECNPIPGNSGSALIDASGQVRGLLHFQIDTEKTTKKIRGYYKIPALGFFNAGIATNFACQIDPNGGRPSQCGNAPPPKRLGEKLASALNARQQSLGRPQSYLEWDADLVPARDGVYSLSPKPVCALNSAGQFDSRARISRPMLTAELQMDRYYHLDPILQSSGTVEVATSLHPQAGGTFLYVEDGREFTIPLCQNQ